MTWAEAHMPSEPPITQMAVAQIGTAGSCGLPLWPLRSLARISGAGSQPRSCRSQLHNAIRGPGAVLSFFLLVVALPTPFDALAGIVVIAVLFALVMVYRIKAEGKYQDLAYERYRQAGIDEGEGAPTRKKVRLRWREIDP